jgi:hypothetical protein
MARMVRIKQKVATLAAVLVAVLASPACQQNGERCAPGDYVICSCPRPVKGFARCMPSGEDYSPCDCSGAAPGGLGALDAAPEDSAADAAPDGEPAVDAGSKLPFMSPCAKDEECETGLCFVFNAKGPRCSKTCQTDADCPAPSPGCNLQKICKSP